MATILVAAACNDLEDDPGNAFVTRHFATISKLRERHTVALLGLRTTEVKFELGKQLAGCRYDEVQVPPSSGTRSARVFLASRQLVTHPLAAWERSIEKVARSVAPDAILTIGPWLDIEYRVLFMRQPTLHLLEEDITPRLRGGQPESKRSELLRNFEDLGKRRAGMVPSVVAVISEPEIARARSRFPQARVLCVPRTLAPADWPLAQGVSQGNHLLVVGNLAEARNAEGLRDIIREMKSRGPSSQLPLRLVSAPGLHPMLDEIKDLSWVDVAPPTDHVAEEYRSARVAVVPARHVTGFKTTVLEAWTSGCPVVCFPASAATLGVGRDSAVVVGDTAAELVDQVIEVAGDDARREELADIGIRFAERDFDHAAAERQLEALLLTATARPRR